MKAIKLLLATLIFIIMTSCCNDDTNEIQCNQVTETIVYDSQDNIVNLNGVWHTCMNLDDYNAHLEVEKRIKELENGRNS